MPGNTFLYRMPAGIPGAISRGAGQATVEPQVLNLSLPFTAYGKFGKIVSEKFIPIAAADAASVVYGLLVRPYPTASSSDGLGTSTPPTSGICDVMRRGYLSVLLNKGTAAKNGGVFVRITAAGGDVVGQIEAGADGGAAVLVVGCVFTGPADANGMVEIAFNI